MEALDAAAALLGAYVAGVVAALTGIGGGVIMVPLFSMVVGLSLRVAGALSLLAIVANATISSTRYMRRGLVDDARAPLYSVGVVLGGVAGGVASEYVDERVLALVFSALLFYTSIRLAGFLGGRGRGGSEAPPSLARSLGVGGLGGVVAGLLGIGGGAVMVPLMINLERMPLRRVIATSSFLTAVAASAALSARLTQLSGLWYAPIVAVASSAGSYTGSSLMPRLPRRILALILAIVLAAVGVRMALRALGA